MKCGLDDYLMVHTAADLRALIDAAPVLSFNISAPPIATEGKPVMIVNDEKVTAVQRAEEVLRHLGARCDDLFNRSDVLVCVSREAAPPKWMERPVKAPTIIPYPVECLAVKIPSEIMLYRKKQTEQRGIEYVPIIEVAPHPLTRAVHSWPCKSKFGVKPLEAVVTCPVFRGDGEIVQKPGYDADSGILYDSECTYPTMPYKPNKDDAQKAARRVIEIVCDIPFELPAHRSGWLALAMTMVARLAIKGCVPFFGIDGNQRGAGKGLTFDVASIASHNREPARMSLPINEEEVEKRLLAIALAADYTVLFDNCRRQIGGAALESALTARSVSGRLLGFTKQIELPFSTILAATGNNLQYSDDCRRRVIPIRLDSQEENPESRTQFKFPNLRQHVARNHPSLLRDLLTILRGFHVAGRPKNTSVPAYGSFEAWSDLIRQAIIWLAVDELPDPYEGRKTFTTAVEEGDESWLEVFDLLPHYYDATGKVKIADLVDAVNRPIDERDRSRGFSLTVDDTAFQRAARMKVALIAVSMRTGSRNLDALKIGQAFAKRRRAPLGGRILDCEPSGGGIMGWFVHSNQGWGRWGEWGRFHRNYGGIWSVC